MADISEIFQRMMKTYCAISKLEYLLEAVRLTYENVSKAARVSCCLCLRQVASMFVCVGSQTIAQMPLQLCIAW